MSRRLLIGAVLAVVLIAMAGQAQAKLSLGSTQSSKQASIGQGGEGSFRIFLFNAHQEEEVEIYLGVYDDAGLSVRVEPESLVVPYSEPGKCAASGPGYACLGTPEGDVSARAVTVRVSVPFEAEPGEHIVVAYAATERQEGTLGSAQVRRFYFTVYVEEGEGIGLGEEIRAEAGGEEEPEIPEAPNETGSTGETGEGLPGSITGAVTGIPVLGPLVLACVIIIFMVLRRLKRI
jgi:hypothetical protein